MHACPTVAHGKPRGGVPFEGKLYFPLSMYGLEVCLPSANDRGIAYIADVDLQTGYCLSAWPARLRVEIRMQGVSP